MSTLALVVHHSARKSSAARYFLMMGKMAVATEMAAVAAMAVAVMAVAAVAAVVAMVAVVAMARVEAGLRLPRAQNRTTLPHHTMAPCNLHTAAGPTTTCRCSMPTNSSG